jgi:hypothetical protein
MSSKIDNFFFRPASPRPLGVLRIGLSAILLIQALMCANQLFEWYGTQGWLQSDIGEKFAAFTSPQTTQFIRWGSAYGISEKTALIVLASIYVTSLLTLLIGFFSRTSAMVAWLLHLTFAEGHITSYGLDLLSHVALFYSIFMPMGACLSVDSLRRKVPSSDTWAARLSLRIWQLHLCIVYFSTGFEKAQGEQWRNGEAIWRSVMLPAYRQFDLAWLSRFSVIAMLFAWGTLVLEMGYPFFIFPRRTRKFWIAGILSLHAGIAIFLGLHLFAALMMLLTFCCFGLDFERSPLAGAGK